MKRKQKEKQRDLYVPRAIDYSEERELRSVIMTRERERARLGRELQKNRERERESAIKIVFFFFFPSVFLGKMTKFLPPDLHTPSPSSSLASVLPLCSWNSTSAHHFIQSSDIKIWSHHFFFCLLDINLRTLITMLNQFWN